MSLLAGYDVVIEISKNAFQRIIQSQVKINTISLSTSFALAIPISVSGINIRASLLVRNWNLILEPGTNRIMLVFSFNSSSIFSENPNLTIRNLNGLLTVKTSILLLPIPGKNYKGISLDSANASVSLQLSRDSQENIREAFAASSLSINLQQFLDTAQNESTNFIRKTFSAPTAFDNFFEVREGQDGSIAPLIFTRLPEIRCIDEESLGIFGTLLVNSQGGNPSLKTSTAITPGNDLSISFSPEVYRRLLFCPAAAKNFKNKLDGVEREYSKEEIREFTSTLMPKCCGGASGVPRGSEIITSLCDSFHDGFIRIDGTFTKSGICYSATGSFYQTLRLQLGMNAEGKQTIESIPIETPDPSIDVSVEWYCQVANFIISSIGLVAPLIGVISVIGVEELADFLGELNSKDQNRPFSSDPTSIPLPELEFKNVQITSEGLILDAIIKNITQPPPQVREIELNGGILNINTEVVNSGTYRYQGNLFCQSKNFPFTESLQQQIAFYQIITTGLSEPLTIEFSLEHYRGYFGSLANPFRLTDSVKLTDTVGEVLLRVDASFPAPLPGGSQLTDQTVRITYEIRGKVITLSNSPSDGNYFITLRVKVIDSSSFISEDTTSLRFKGNAVAIGGGYDAYIAECNEKLGKSLIDISGKIKVKPIPFPRGGDPSPDDLIRLVRFIDSVNLSGLPQAQIEQLLAQTRIRYGEVFDRAVFSPELLGSVLRNNRQF